jgi:hypothetical protein
VRATPLLLFLAFGFLATDAIRFTAWLAIAGAWILAHNLRSLELFRRRATAVVLALALAAGSGAVLVRGDVRGRHVGFDDAAPMSEAAIAFLQRHGIAGNVFNAFNQGDQLVHHFYPRMRVVIDSRLDAYGEAYYLWYRTLEGRSYRQLGTPPVLLDFLDRHAVNTIVTRPGDLANWSRKGHLAALAATGWRQAYADARTVILRRRPAGD